MWFGIVERHRNHGCQSDACEDHEAARETDRVYDLRVACLNDRRVSFDALAEDSERKLKERSLEVDHLSRTVASRSGDIDRMREQGRFHVETYY